MVQAVGRHPKKVGMGLIVGMGLVGLVWERPLQGQCRRAWLPRLMSGDSADPPFGFLPLNGDFEFFNPGSDLVQAVGRHPWFKRLAATPITNSELGIEND